MNNKELTELKREFAEVLDDAFEDKSYLVDKPQMIEEDALFEQVLDRAWEWVGQKLTQSNDEIKRKVGRCKLCNKETDCVYNINLKATSICEGCGRAIAKQELDDMFQNQKENNE